MQEVSFIYKIKAINQSSALGELFDHGCDALSSMLQAVVIISTTQLGGTIYGFGTVSYSF
jgi:hypothetical protein